MSDWIYPISAHSGRTFVDTATGRSVPVSYETFRDLVLTGRINDVEWTLSTGYRRMRSEDRVWVYTGDRDLGIIGAATVRGVRAPSGTDPATVLVRWDISRSRQLAADPLPAVIVRRFIRWPRRPALLLDNHPALLQQLDGWPASRIAADRAVLLPLNLKPVREIVVQHRSQSHRALLDHDSFLGPLRRGLSATDWAVGCLRTELGTAVDLAALKDGQCLIVEAKKIASRTGRDEARVAFGQLHEYWWEHAPRLPSGTRFLLWAAFSKRPSDDVVHFLEHYGVIVSWGLADGRLILAPGLRDKAESLLGTAVAV